MRKLLQNIKDQLIEPNKGINETYKKAGHLTDQMLKYNYPRDNQPSLFDVLQEGTKRDIDAQNIERSEIVEGIKLSPSETKIVDSLCTLLHYTSQNLDPEKPNYYTGNDTPVIIQREYGATPAPKLAFTIYELTKQYLGTDKKVGGKDLDNVYNTLIGLSEKRFLMKYKEEITKSKGEKTINKIEIFERIIKIAKITREEFKNNISQSKKEDTIVILHPIFRSQINSKFILYPKDIIKQTILAYGSPNVSQITLTLRDYLIRELSSKRYQPEIGLERLYYLVAEKWMRESRKTRVKKDTDKALDTVIKMGLLISYDIKTSQSGEPKVIFNLNKEWI
jgi:hypothetical protein